MKRTLALCLSLLLLSGCAAAQTPKQQSPPDTAQQQTAPAKEESSEQTQPDEPAAEEPSLTWVTDLPKVSFVPDWTVETSSETFLLELSDPKYQGRVVGSEGNRAAADYIEEQLVQLGLQPLPNLQGYRHPFYSPVFEVKEGEAAIVSADGTQTALVLGQDWVFRASYEAVDLTLPLSEETADCEAGRAFLDANVTDQDSPRQYIDLICGDVADGMPYFNPKDSASRILVTEQIYTKLKQDGAKLHLKLPAAAQWGLADNVAGLLPGEEHTKAVVLGAHFDGVGQCGSVMPGAYDNASGVATLLQIASWLAGADALPCDVIITTFNAEEIGMNGSQAFSKLLADQYEQMIMINLDSLGCKGAPLTVFGGPEQATLRNELAAGLSLPFLSEVYPGDQVSFQQNGVPAVTISQDSWDTAAPIHTTRDTAENLDPQALDALAKNLSAWVIESGSDVQQRYPVYW